MKQKNRFMLGICLLIIGVIAILHNLQIINYDWNWRHQWPYLILAFGIVKLLVSFPNAISGGIFFSLSGIFLLCYLNGFFNPYDYTDLYPVVFVIIGLSHLAESLVPRFRLPSFMTGLAITVPSIVWLMNNIFWNYSYSIHLYLGLFLVLIGLRFIILYWIQSRSSSTGQQNPF
ncbi:MAG: hypothetical protein KBA26_02975 [Candidatus Delongbacteria bacterium]|nr:hypothetical protein [Candidatus Delongbacteria bacterium]